MKVEITREPMFSTINCIKLTSENMAEEIILGEIFEESNAIDNSELDWFVENTSEVGHKDITIFKKK